MVVFFRVGTWDLEHVVKVSCGSLRGKGFCSFLCFCMKEGLVWIQGIVEYIHYIAVFLDGLLCFLFLMIWLICFLRENSSFHHVGDGSNPNSEASSPILKPDVWWNPHSHWSCFVKMYREGGCLIREEKQERDRSKIPGVGRLEDVFFVLINFNFNTIYIFIMYPEIGYLWRHPFSVSIS